MSTSILTEMIGYLVGALTGIGQGIGAALSTLVSSVFLTTSGDTTSLSAFGAIICIFAGLSLAFGLTRWIVNLITSFGQRNR